MEKRILEDATIRQSKALEEALATQFVFQLGLLLVLSMVMEIGLERGFRIVGKGAEISGIYRSSLKTRPCSRLLKGIRSLKDKNSDLRKNIENLEKNSVTSLRTFVILGSEVYMQADVPDTRRIFVDIGLGFHVEFTWSEALSYITAREEKLARQIEEYTRLMTSIKAQIKMVCEGIRELLQLQDQGSY
ncbi:hypothetical protein LOK49_LG03G00657 [Camellia lanceoleosa]|uniref:Uncharacterized protein n=1 Tax=Camellia lanceoleosa TaxID=1840588 RepID=A0ACC0I8P7_9ERIC|nr:hypothetical protein LOK49_LG03G00657 [Camellia lanceoleosa]